MDKEKQIEEITKYLDTCSYRLTNFTTEESKRIALALYYEAGVRKITENKVVINKEEYERLKRVETEKDRLYEMKLDLENQLIQSGLTEYIGADEIEKQARKETVEKFVNSLTTFIGHLIPSEYSIMDIIIEIENKIYDLAKQYGVDLGEVE